MNLGQIKDFNRYVYIAFRRVLSPSGVEPKHYYAFRATSQTPETITSKHAKYSILFFQIDTHFSTINTLRQLSSNFYYFNRIEWSENV